MTLLAPLTAAAAAAIGVPILLLLYVLKLRRRTLRWPSTMLWVESSQDLQANVPFQRLRPSWLLWLQLALILLLVTALAEPVLRIGARPTSRTILLLDISASMQTRVDASRTRLDVAKETTRALIEQITRGGDASAMLIVMGRTPRVLIGASRDRRALLDALERVIATDEVADLDAALALAGVFATREETLDHEPPQILLISDASVRPPADPGGFKVDGAGFRFIDVSGDEPVANLGIITLTARRDSLEATSLRFFARVANTAEEAATTVLTLRADGESLETRSITIPGATDAGPGELGVTFEQTIAGDAVVTLSLTGGDALSADDTAAVVVAAPPTPRVTLVHPAGDADPFVVGLIEAMEPRYLVRIEAADDGSPVAPLPSGDSDILIYDRVTPTRLGDTPSLFFGAAPPGLERLPPIGEGGRRVSSWQREHAILRHVSLDTLVFSGTGGLQWPAATQAEPVAWGPDGPVVAVVSASAARHVVVSFALRESNWPLDVSLVVFMQNTWAYLLAAGSSSRSVRPGELITIRARPGVTSVSVTGPLAFEVPLRTPPMVTLPALPYAGVYRVRGAQPPADRLAVNVASVEETDIRPRRELMVNARATLGAAASDVTPRSLWPWAAAAAAVLLILEWLVYCRRSRL